MATALADLGALDHDPAISRDQEAVEGAWPRLEALTDRGSECFTEPVFGHMCDLIREHGITELLGVLRRLGLQVGTYRRPVVELARKLLEDRAVVDAARCLVDFRSELSME